MYLRSLELQGFKSFPDKTLLEFGSDITAIVGPNGSGKSNISDAIRWVMGEQSTKALRGGKMEDVIFGGTQKRAQLGFAEATLTLDNSDHVFDLDAKQIMVTRRYYRSGESEYYINRKLARLRDLNELFMDTGLGREGYSNISQGRIDEILSLKSTDRREIFEEAAGISKYRHRKEETERRLMHTEENLMRIGDKISELELQVEPLREQAEKAKKYLNYRDQLKGLEITVWLDQLEKLRAATQKAEQDFASASFILQQEHERLDELYALSERLSERLHGQDVEIENQREKIAELDAQTQQLASQLTIAQEKLENNRGNIAHLRADLTEATDRSGAIEEQMQQQRRQLTQLEQEVQTLEAQLQQELAQSQSLLDQSNDCTRRLTGLHERQRLQMQRLAAAQSDKSASDALAAQIEKNAQQLQQDLAQAAVRCAQAQESLDECGRRLAAAREQVRAGENAIAGYRLRYQAQDERRTALQKQQNDLTVSLGTLAAKIRMYEDIEKSYQGFTEAVRTVMHSRDKGVLHRIYGTVAQLIRAKDEYVVAIETALGGGMQNIVVETEQDAKAAMQLLKRQKGGRATFYPLRTVKGNLLRETGLEKISGFVGVASELVHYEPKYEPVVRYLLGRIVVVENLDCAITAARQYGHRFKIVTLDGQVINAGGSMTGGSVAKSAGFLSRANELERLRGQKQKLQQQQEELDTRLREAVRGAEQTAFELEAAQEQLRQEQDAVLRLEGEEKQAQILLQTLNQTRQSAQKDLQTLEDERARTAQDAGQSEDLLAKLEAELTALEAELTALESEQTAALERHRGASERVTQMKMRIAAQQAEQTAADQALQRLSELREQLQGDGAQKQKLIEQYDAEIAALNGEKERLTAQQTQQAALAQQMRADLDGKLAARRKLEEQKTGAEKDAQEKNRRILDLERENARLEQKKISAQMEEKQIIDRLWDNYELTQSTAAKFAVEVESLAAAQRKIAELRRKIGQLGTPNLGAIDEFARVNERYAYLTGQRDDVLQAKNDLLAIIRDITKQMTQIFTGEFAKISDYFSKTFTEMFGGGRASLSLEDETQPLTCGIEINVQPPGKQLKTITLLSGGEKAFVAIALYFAILKVRPTPFCMLDEIDAALDDRNVERFAGYLRQLSEKTQFIIITHRRGTMELADVLYGVTMQEHGVSKILHLDLNQMERELHLSEG